MKLQIDTDGKSIKVEGSVKFKELISTLNKLFPKKEWMDYELETQTTIYNWSSPITIPYNPPITVPYYPLWVNSGCSDEGVYNFEVIC